MHLYPLHRSFDALSTLIESMDGRAAHRYAVAR
jgi:hypothetical protein